MMMCIACNSIKRAESKRSSAKRILTSLERLTPREYVKTIESNKDLKKDLIKTERLLYNSKSNIKLTCGRCVKFNSNEFSKIESNINKKVAYLTTYMKYISKDDIEKAKKIKLNLCSILRGNYPIAYRLVDKNFITECIRGKENEVI